MAQNAPSMSPPSPEHRPTRLIHWVYFAVLVSLIITVDQLSKAYVVAHLDLGESWMPLGFIEPVFRFTLVHNTGAAFGMFPQGGSIFLGIAVVVTLVILYYYQQLPGPAWLVRTALALQLGGALGNVIDRVRLGYVVDFFNVELWPVFNIADSSIVVGVVLLAFELLREEWRAMRQPADEPSDVSSSSENIEAPELGD